MLRFAVLVSLVLFKLGSGDKQFSLDSDDAQGTPNWDGLVVLVQSDEKDEPEIVLSSNVDGYSLAYCLTLEEIFEADSYDVDATSATFGAHEEVSSSEIDFQNDVTWTYTEGANGDSFTLVGVPSGSGGDHSVFTDMTFTFNVATSEAYNTTYGIEYIFALNGYEWTSSNADAVLVLVFEFKSCGEEFSSSDFDGEDTEEQDTEADTEADTDTEATRRRRRRRRRRMARLSRGRRSLLEDAEDTEAEDGAASDDGISEDDSQEADVGIATFVNHGTAHCVNSSVEIPTSLVYGGELDEDEMHMVFQHFTCSDIEQDPWVGLLGSKRDAANHFVVAYAVVIGAFLCLFQ
jgi:hypothetical protein